MQFLALIFGWWVYRPYSCLIRLLLISKGIKVGKRFYIQGVPYLKIYGSSSRINIGNNVSIYGNIDLRNRENGTIIIEDNVSFDTNCRLVAANNATLLLKEGVSMGGYCVFNCGTHVSVGKNTMLAGNCHIQSSNHGMKKSQLINLQDHTYGEIDIGDDCWLGQRVSVTLGVVIGDGAIVGAGAVVTRDLDKNSKNVGVPARKIGERD
jgi:acetyltransferase-like isoleucine patch superfamily enzyme